MASYVRYDVTLLAGDKVYIVLHVFSKDLKRKKDDVKKYTKLKKIKKFKRCIKILWRQ